MEFVELFFWLVKGFFGLIAGLVVLVLVFGKRVEKKWEYEAKFRDEQGREIGEFDIARKRFAKERGPFELAAKFVLRHPALRVGERLRVYLEEVLVMEGVVESAGRIRLGLDDVRDPLESPSAGQICSVVAGSQQLYAEALYED